MVTLPFEQGNSALFSSCRIWRYALWRLWADYPVRPLIVIGLNPSTADELYNDPTVTRCISLAKRDGYDGLIMLNLFGYRSPYPEDMRASPDPVGADNWDVIQSVCAHYRPAGSPVVAAWGCHGAHRNADSVMVRALPALECLGKTKHGHPKHPLYLRSDVQIVPYARDGRLV